MVFDLVPIQAGMALAEGSLVLALLDLLKLGPSQELGSRTRNLRVGVCGTRYQTLDSAQ
jgi:hypothetical protein